MNIVQFLDEVGSSRVSFQVLHQCITGATAKRGGNTEVRFLTTEMSPGDLVCESRRVGFVVWMDRADFERAATAAKAA